MVLQPQNQSQKLRKRAMQNKAYNYMVLKHVTLAYIMSMLALMALAFKGTAISGCIMIALLTLVYGRIARVQGQVETEQKYD